MAFFNRRISIQEKLSYIFILTIVIPLIIFSFLLFRNQNKMIEEKIIDSVNRETIQTSDMISHDFLNIKSITNLFYLDEELNKILIDYNSGKIKNLEEFNFNKIMSKYNSGINRINFQTIIITNDNKIYGNAMFKDKVNKINLESENWHRILEKSPANIYWIKSPILDTIFTTTDYPYVYIVRKIHDRSTWKPVGTLVLGISENEIRKMYSGYVSENNSVLIVDEKNNLVSNIDNLNLNMDTNIIKDYLHHHSGNFKYKINGQNLLVSYYTINATGWKMFSFYDLNSLLSAFDSINNRFVLLIILYLALAILIALISLKGFTKSINLLYCNMEKVKGGNLNARVPVISNDEIGELSQQFNLMVENIEELMEELVEEQEAKREAELVALQTQINPHFLYNTFASIRYLIYTENKEDADAIILSFIRLMKNILSDTKEFITIEKEISLLKDYIYIQKLALANEVEVNINIDEDIRDIKMIKLLLQPLVENAFLHGLKPKKGKGYIEINGYGKDDIIVFEIIDNGVGFNVEDLGKLEKPDSNSIGLKNIEDRIVLIYGDEYGLEINSTPQKGTKIVIRFPKID